MKIDRPINWLLTLLFGTMPDGDRKVWFHSQNLNENKHGEPKGLPYHGRCWLHFGKKSFNFSWNFWTHFCGIELAFDPSEDGWKFHWAFPPVSFWWSTNIFSKWMCKLLASEKVDKWNQKYDGYPGSSRYTEFKIIDIRIFSWAFWWEFLKFDWGSSSKDPKWMRFTFHFDDFFLGRMKHECVKIGEPKQVMVPMPEGEYLTLMQLERSTWKRPRLPWNSKVMTGYDITIPKGIPHQGKGENSWDCGEDALMGCYSEGDSLKEAIAKVQMTVLKDRKRYDGNMMAKYPDPATRKDESPPDNSMNGSPVLN